MKRYMKVFLKIAIALSLIICMIVSVNGSKSHADAGYHSSYGGGSSSSSSSSYHSSSSSGSSYHSYGSSSSGSSYSGEDSWLALIVWIIIAVVVLLPRSRSSSSRASKAEKLHSDATAIDKLKQLIPEFDEKQFLQDGYKIFLDVEDAWMNFNLEKVRDCITDEMFNMYESQLSSMEIKGEQNIMKDFVLKESAITRCTQQNDSIEVIAKYIIEFYDYIIDKSTGKVLRGNKHKKIRMHYSFTFIMSKDIQKIDNCPNCGAPLEINSAGICEYCGSKVIGNNTSWVMSKKLCTRQENL